MGNCTQMGGFEFSLKILIFINKKQNKHGKKDEINPLRLGNETLIER